MRKNQRLPRTFERAREIHAWVRAYKKAHDYGPSIQEVSDAFGIVPSHVQKFRVVMVEMKLMKPVARNIERAWPLRRLPRANP